MDLDYKERIVENLPYGDGFKFVDQLLELDEERVVGVYRFRESENFYQHHFIDRPITPGVILLECMAQIGLACLGSHLAIAETPRYQHFAFSESHVQFLKAVYPNTAVVVSAVVVYYRFGKLKVQVQMVDDTGEKVAEGWISGVGTQRKID